MERRDFLVKSMVVAAGAGLPRITMAQGVNSADWQPLFNGKDLSGWTFYQEGVGARDMRNAVTVHDGMLHFMGPDYQGDDAPAPPGHIATKDQWGNFHLRLEYRWGDLRWLPREWQRRNSGILYHMGPETNLLFPNSVEFQVQESDVGDAIMINTMALQGPLLGGTPLWPNWIMAFPSEYQEPVKAGPYARQWHRQSGSFAQLDGWNTLDIIAFDDQAAHLVNGRIVNTLFSIVQADASGVLQPLTRGRIALELEQAEIMFRNVMIRPLDAPAVERIKQYGSS